MKNYSISSKVSGHVFGVYGAASAQNALDALAQDAEAGNLRNDSELIVAEVCSCECGAVTGVKCEVGPTEHTVVLEWMPRDLRSSHVKAGNRGQWPHNGAIRLTLEETCADLICDTDSEWSSIVK